MTDHDDTETITHLHELLHETLAADIECQCGELTNPSDGLFFKDCPRHVHLPEFIAATANALPALLAAYVARAQADVANAFVAWAAANEIAAPPLDWAWFGEITRRYSNLHEEADRD
jgi:hypothetical protein